ncbi:hypothetical protein Scep_018085 [Stephania cephalantha]|uniref:F-box protein SKIP14 n=1 Tax=Stephania cephalantha TaxID=152367 RepID=A0AAP0NU85_9MAGN
MTLNYSHRPVFCTNPSEDNLVSSARFSNGYVVGGIQDRGMEGFGIPQFFNWEIGNPFDCGMDRRGCRGGSQSPVASDFDFLPSDPFGMGISATFTAITGWVEEIDTDSLDLMWNKAMTFQAEPGNMGLFEQSNPIFGGLNWWAYGDGLRDSGHASISNADESRGFADVHSHVPSQISNELGEGSSGCSCSGGDGAPHDALLFSLGYLGVQDLLSVEMVCKSSHSAVRNDTLIWKNIHIDQPLNERINDDALLQLTKHAQGNLQCLSLVECLKISDDGLRRVLDSNPRLTKLNVAGCTRLTVDGIIDNLKAFKSSGTPGIKNLRIGGRYGVTLKHFEELKSLVGAENYMQPASHKPQFYRRGYSSISCDDERAIDIEVCPRCQNLRLVYDCPAESCREKGSGMQMCRACLICIARCFECGRCISDSEYEETFCLDLLCLDCGKQPVQRQEGDEEGAPASESSISLQLPQHIPALKPAELLSDM